MSEVTARRQKLWMFPPNKLCWNYAHSNRQPLETKKRDFARIIRSLWHLPANVNHKLRPTCAYHGKRTINDDDDETTINSNVSKATGKEVRDFQRRIFRNLLTITVSAFICLFTVLSIHSTQSQWLKLFTLFIKINHMYCILCSNW